MKYIFIILLFSCLNAGAQTPQRFWYFAGTRIANTSYDPDAQALFTAIEGAGNTLTANEKTYTNNLIVSGKASNNWWANGSGGALYLILGSTASSHSYNAFNPATFQLTYTGTVTHTSTHMVSNGTTGYANTGFNMATNDVDAFATIACWVRNTPADGVHVAIGAISATNRYTQIYPRLGNTFYGQVNSNNVITENMGNSTAGMFIATRLNSTNEYVQKNNSRTDVVTTANAITNNNLYIMCQNSNGSAANFGTHQIAMCAIFTTPLSTAQASQFYTDINTWITAMGR